MEINYTLELNQKFQKVAINKEIVNETELVFTFRNTDVIYIANAIKDAHDDNIHISTETKFGNIDDSYLSGCDFDYKIDTIFDDLCDTDGTFTISFKPSYVHKNLSQLLMGNEKDILKKICLFACHSTTFVDKSNEHTQKLISIDLENGFQIIEIPELLKHPKINERMVIAFNMYIEKYLEKISSVERFNLELKNILNAF